MYRTEDIYQNLVVKNTIKYDSKKYCELAKQFDLLGQFPYESIEKMIGSYFLTNNTYKSYRKYYDGFQPLSESGEQKAQSPLRFE